MVVVGEIVFFSLRVAISIKKAVRGQTEWKGQTVPAQLESEAQMTCGQFVLQTNFAGQQQERSRMAGS